MQNQAQIDDLGFCPSFSCYSSDTPSSTAAAKVSRQLQQEQAARFHDHDDDVVDGEDFEFSLVIGDEEFSAEDFAAEDRVVFPLFNRDFLIHGEVDRQEAVQGKVEDVGDACSASLGKLFINEREESSSSSSSEADELESESPGVFCVWRPKMEVGSSPLTKCKKSSSTGSGSKRWRIRDLLRRSNSEGKEPMVVLTPKKVENPKQKRNSAVVAGKSKASSPSIHELFYVQQRAKNEDGKRKSYLPYRQGLVGFFTNVNGKGKGKKSPF